MRISLLILLAASTMAHAQERVRDQYAGDPPANLMKGEKGKLAWVDVLGSTKLRASRVGALAWSADGKTLMTVDNDIALARWQWPEGRRISRKELQLPRGLGSGFYCNMAMSRDGKRLALTEMGGSTGVLLILDGMHKIPLKLPRSFIHSLALDGKGNRMLVGFSSGQALSVSFDRKHRKKWFACKPKGTAVTTVALSADGKAALAFGNDGLAHWELPDAMLIERWAAPGVAKGVRTMAFSADGKRAVSGGFETVKLWDLSNGKNLKSWTIGGEQRAVAFTPDGKHVLAQGALGHLIRIPVDGDAPAPEPAGLSIRFHPDGKRAISGGVGELIVWSVENAKPVARWKTPSPGTPVSGVYLAAEGTRAFSVSAAQLICWDVEKGAILWKTEQSEDWKRKVSGFGVSADGKRALVARQGKLALLDAATGETIVEQIGKLTRGTIKAPALSSDGMTGYSVLFDKLVIWDLRAKTPLKKHEFECVESGKTPQTMDSPQDFVLSRDERWLLVSSRRGKLKYWDRKTRILKAELTGHLGQVFGIATSADGKIAASVANDGLRVWDLEKGELIDAIRAEGQLRSVSIQGELIAVGGWGGAVRIYKLTR